MWVRRARIKVLSISNGRLDVEGSISEVGIPPPNNLEKYHAPVAGNYHTNTTEITDMSRNKSI